MPHLLCGIRHTAPHLLCGISNTVPHLLCGISDTVPHCVGQSRSIGAHPPDSLQTSIPVRSSRSMARAGW